MTPEQQETVARALEDQLSYATDNSINAEVEEVKITVKLMCLRARIVFGEQAKLIYLDDSDQGDWATVNDVVDAKGDSLLEDIYWDDGNDYASHMYDSRAQVWVPYLLEDSWGGRHNPGVGVLDIDKVMEAIDKGEL
jgi:hypothetical protein